MPKPLIGDVTGLIANIQTNKPYRRDIFSPDPIGWPRESGEGWIFARDKVKKVKDFNRYEFSGGTGTSSLNAMSLAANI